MITDKARDLFAEARTSEGQEARMYSRLAWYELFNECKPTQDEFTEFAAFLILPSDVLWELILRVPQWDSVSRVKSDAK